MEGESISLYESGSNGHTKVSNHFIDHFMTNANEAQIKIYLYLLRSVSSGKDISLPLIADRFNYTERDIIRSLIYWDKQGLITLDYDENRNVKGICLNVVEKPVVHNSTLSVSGVMEEKDTPGVPDVSGVSGVSNTAPARPFYPAGQLQEFRNNPGMKGLLFTAEQYLKRTLSSSDLNSILYLYDNLHFDAALIEYLIEYCVNAGHRNIRYIESVGRDWDERGVRTVEQARYETGVNRKEYYDVLKAFGLSGRNPVKVEIDYIRRWRDEYGFSSDLIIEAVNRTMSAISKPSFQYADSILQRWKKDNISKLSDIEDADKAHEAAKKEKAVRTDSASRSGSTMKFQNFSERDYDFSELEKKFARN
ncbi:MAG: DnaD domain protein [Lachnospiraceae bacterium]|nr:DnaD domain protein [Lachnospiraceae bacterium]